MTEHREARSPDIVKDKPRRYVIVSGQPLAQKGSLENQLDEYAAEGYRPILMSSCANQAGISITIILERDSQN
jgi:hypothetical protein